MENLLNQIDQLIKGIVSNPYFGLIGFIIGLAGLIFSYYLAKRDRRSKGLNHTSVSTNIISKNEALFPKLSIKYDNQDLESLTVTKISIKNTGTEVIKIDDIAQADPITLGTQVDSNVRLLDYGVSYVSDKLNNFELQKIDDSKVLMKFDYIEPKDFIIVQILHTGKENKDIVVSGTVIGAKEPFVAQANTKSTNTRSLMERFMFPYPRLWTILVFLLPLIGCGFISYASYILTDNIFIGSLFLLPVVILVWLIIRLIFAKPDKDRILLTKDELMSQFEKNFSLLQENELKYKDKNP